MEFYSFGNVTFGEAAKFLVKIVGQEAVLSLLPEKEYGAAKKQLARVYNDRAAFSKLSSYEKDNFQYYFDLFFRELKNEYGVPDNIKKFIDFSIWQLFYACASNTPFEKNKSDTVLFLLRKQIFHLLDYFLRRLYSKPAIIDFLAKITDTLNGYKNIFKETAKEMTNGNESKLFDEINGFSNQKSKELETTIDKQKINRWDGGNSPRWKTFKKILDFFKSYKKTNIVHQLIGIYLIMNTKKALDELFQIKSDGFEKFILDITSMLIENKKPEEFYDVDFGIGDSMEYHLLTIHLLGITQQNIEMSEAEGYIEECEKQMPSSSKFFLPWFRARAEVYLSTNNPDMDRIRGHYRKAFDDGKYFAGCFLIQFILEALAVENYIDKYKRQVTNFKDYYEFGRALEIFIIND
jgi:hypothetical protein